MRILGIDPGLATTGIGLIDAQGTVLTALDWLTIETKCGLSLSERLREIERDLKGYLEESRPDLVVVERLFFATNARSAIDVAHARGVILQTVATHEIPLLEPTPLELKSSIAGDGRADKRQVLSMLERWLKLEESPTPDDAADALALAVYGSLHTQDLLLRAMRSADE